MSTKSMETTKTVGAEIRSQIEELYETACNLHGTSGYFVAKSTMARIEETLDRLMDGSVPTSQDPSTLIKLNDQLNEVTKRAERAEARLKSSELEAAKTAKNLTAAKEALASKEQLLASVQSEQNQQRENLQQEIKTLRGKIDKAKKSSSTTTEESEDLVAKYKTAQAELTALNKEKKAAQSELRNAKDQVAALESQLAATAARAEQMKLNKDTVEGRTWAEHLGDLKEMEPMPDFDSAVLLKAFDKETLELVKKAAESKRNSLRDYALNISRLANKTDPRSFVGLKDYCWALYLRVKDTDAKDRGKYRQLLDDTYAAIAHRGSKKLKEIRVEYASVFNPSEAEKKQTEKMVKEKKASWWQSIKRDFWFARKTFSVSVRSALARKGSFWTKTKDFFSTLWSYWKP